MSGDLYTKVQDATSSSGNGGKVRIGYTVNKYDGVLSQLKKAVAKMKNNNSNGSSSSDYGGREAIFEDATNLGSISDIGTIISNDGFVLDGTDYEKYRQQRVLLKPFMPFVVDIQEQTEKIPYFIPYKSPCGKLNEGTGTSGKATFPIPNISVEYCDQMINGLGSGESSVEMGIGVDLTDEGTADAFFKQCYNKIYKKGCAGRAASKKALMAEVAFINGSQASTLHARVIANSGLSPQNAAHSIYIPVPLLLTSEYRSLAEVYFNYTKNYKVGGGECSYPLENARYNHVNATLDGYTPKFIKNIITKQNRVLSSGQDATIKFNSAADKNGVVFAYIRFYIQPGANIDGVFNTNEIPDEYKTELYKGLGTTKVEQIQVGWTEAAAAAVGIGDSNNSPYYAPNQVNWDRIKRRGEKYEKNIVSFRDDWEAATRAYNINTRLVLSLHCWETGWAGASPNSTRAKEYAWMTCNNPAGLLCNDASEPYDRYRARSQFGGIQAAKDSGGTGDGRFWKFKSKEDGIKALCHNLVNSSYYGLRLRGYTSIEHFCLGLQLGKKYPQYKNQNPIEEGAWNLKGQDAYCPTPGYGKSILGMYTNSL